MIMSAVHDRVAHIVLRARRLLRRKVFVVEVTQKRNGSKLSLPF
jgi:hypothetical protein